jgi:uncharacterized membrane protein YidH (DUF202 family)
MDQSPKPNPDRKGSQEVIAITIVLVAISIAYIIWYVPWFRRRRRMMRKGEIRPQSMALRMGVGAAGVAVLLCFLLFSINHPS